MDTLLVADQFVQVFSHLFTQLVTFCGITQGNDQTGGTVQIAESANLVNQNRKA